MRTCLNFGIYVGEEEGKFGRLLTMRCVYVFVLALDEIPNWIDVLFGHNMCGSTKINVNE